MYLWIQVVSFGFHFSDDKGLCGFVISVCKELSLECVEQDFDGGVDVASSRQAVDDDNNRVSFDRSPADFGMGRCCLHPFNLCSMG